MYFTWEKGLILQRAFYKSRISSSKELAVMPGKSKRTIQREIKRGRGKFGASNLSKYQAIAPFMLVAFDLTSRELISLST